MITAEVTFSKENLVGLKYPMQYSGIDWQTYREIANEIGETRSLQLIYHDGTLTIMPITEIHEMLTILLERMVGLVSLTLRQNIIPTGKATIRSKRRNLGVEPDVSYFVSNADIHQGRDHVSDEVDIPPDIVGEIDLHNASDEKFDIYAELNISELWQFRNSALRMFRLNELGKYEAIERSVEVPILTGDILTEFLNRGQKEQQFVILSDFQNWLQENK
ncbi:MAG: Uma2 family endonuclease [Pyrinomonadaceae bacterium]|nr:Uma2 family endonuclease [Pyrinomonadaceae bacterium]